MKRSKIFNTRESYFEHLDLLDSAAKEGDLQELETILAQLGARNLRRTETPMDVLIPNMILVETYWNAIHIALHNNNFEIVKYLIEEIRIDAASSMRLAKDSLNADRSHNVEHEAFPLFLAILQGNMEMFNYLWLEHEHFWNQNHLIAVITLIEDKNAERFAGEILNNKTSHDIFKYLTLDEKVEFMSWLANSDYKYEKLYKKALLKKPYRWIYLLYRAKNMDDISEGEAQELKAVGKDIKEDEFEMKEDEDIEHYHTLIKELSKLDEDDEQFKIYKAATSKLIDKPEYEKYKADDDEKLLTEIDEEEEDVKGEESEEESEDEEDFEFPTPEEFCQWAEEGKLKKIKLAVKHKEFIDINNVKGYDNQVMIGEEEYNTELWNPIVFAINANQLEVVKFFLNEVNVNSRLVLIDPDKQDIEYSEDVFFDIKPIDEIQNLLITIQNMHVEMFKLLWDSNYTVWTEEHMIDLFNHLIEGEWHEGLIAFMESRTTREIFISVPFKERQELFSNVIEITEEIEDEDLQKYLYSALSESPYSMNMVISKFDDEDMEEYVTKAKGNFKDSEYNFIIFSGEYENYIKILEANKEKEIIVELMRFKDFMQTHYRINVNNAAAIVLQPHTKKIDLFEKEPRYAHLNLHKIALVRENEVVFPHIKDKKALEYFKEHNWDFISVALLSKNTDIFNYLMKQYHPLTSMIFEQKDEEFSDKENNEYISNLQALIQYSNDLDTLFNSLENHPSLFTFHEVYLILKNVLQNRTEGQVKILNSKAVKSWFCFSNQESKIKLIEEMFDWADENKATLKALGNILLTPCYNEYFSKALPEQYEEFQEKAEGGKTEHSDTESESEAESEGEADEDEAESDSEEGESEEESEEADEASDSSEEPSESESIDDK